VRSGQNFPTNDGLTCVAIQAPVVGFHNFRSDIEGNFFQTLDAVPELAERVATAPTFLPPPPELFAERAAMRAAQ
jgi:hypothetical protein